ncbi:MAG: hypothetical protein JWN40_3822 [Phycisphaerales bacterium]|nr:hypothetical protein [Phycisphaerales bacterium]
MSQLAPCQVDVMHLYTRAVAAGLLPRWIEPLDPTADNSTLLHAWAALARVLPKVFPGEVISITSRTPVIDLPDDRYKVRMTEQNAPLFVDHSESMVRLMLIKLAKIQPQRGGGSSGATATATPQRSMTQDDVDREVAAYKAARAANYNDLRDGVRAKRPGAVKAARKNFGRNHIARQIGCKSSAMVSKSLVYQTIKTELHLNDKRRTPQRTGLDVAANRVAHDAGNSTIDAVVANETRALLRKHLQPTDAEAAIDKLDAGQMTDEQARELVDVYREQRSDAKSRQIR